MNPAQAIDAVPVTPIHLHHPVLFHTILWTCFLIGLLVNIFARAAIVSWSKKSPIKTVKEYLAANWGAVTVRTFLLCVIFSLWNAYPASAAKALEFLADKLSWGGLQGMLSEFGLPLNPPIAAICGYAGDSLFDKVLTRFPSIGIFLHIPGSQPPQQAPPDPDAPAKP